MSIKALAARTKHAGFRLAAAVSLIAAVSCGGESADSQSEAAPSPPLEESAAADRSAAGWPTHGGDYAERRFAQLVEINVDTVARLKLAWHVDLDTFRGQEATPLVIDGVLYATTAWSKAIAVDAETGDVLWTYDPEVPGRTGLYACCDVVNRGPAWHEGNLIISTLDGRLIALDGKTGEPVWSTMTVDPSKPYTITGAPRVAKGKVYIGNGGAELGVRGYVSAYDAKSGALVWRFYTVPGDPAIDDGAASDEILETLARPTWFGEDYYAYGGGGTVWDSIVFDEELDQLYIGVGNGSPWNRRIRSQNKGDNLFLSSVVALDPDTGDYLWHYQETPGDSWDFTSTQQIVLADYEIDGETRKAIYHAPKNGFFYILDRTDGTLLSAEKFAPANWAERVDLETGRPVETPGARFIDAPFIATIGASGAHNWHPMAYSPQTGLMYIPAQQVPFLYLDDQKFRFTPGLWNLGVDMMSTPLPEAPADIAAMSASLQGWLLAWDPIAQKEVWRAQHETAWNGGVLATAGKLVFQGLADGTFRAYDATSGAELWRFDAQTGLLAGPISYSVNGKQHIAILAGNGGGFPLALPAFDGPSPAPPGRILVFTLDGADALPPLPDNVPALDPPNQEWSAETVSLGAQKYAQLCAGCHGMGTHSAGIVPDLRRSNALKDHDFWEQIVVGGLLEDRGMVSFAPYLEDGDAEAIRAYVTDRAHKAREQAHGADR